MRAARTERNAQLFAMRREGKTLRAIAEAFGLSVVRVHTLIKREMDRTERTLFDQRSVKVD